MKHYFALESTWQTNFSSTPFFTATPGEEEEGLHRKQPPPDLSQNKLINTAIHTFLVASQFNQGDATPTPNNSAVNLNCDILSSSSRAVTLAGWNEQAQQRNIIRVSRHQPRSQNQPILSAKDLSGVDQASDRIIAFGEFMKQKKQIRGIVPFAYQPTVLLDQFLIEQYEEIVCVSDNNSRRRVDLHSVVMGGLDGDNARRSFMYLYDVLCGIVELHRHGWVHMDVSFENIVVDNDHAYLVDFESVLPTCHDLAAAIRRKDIGVPVKAPFVPPEHYMSRKNDLLHLPSYDVWAFGVMFFTVLFREYLFGMRPIVDRNTNRQYVVPVSEQIKYFTAHGFQEFCRKYHNDKYLLMFDTANVRVKNDPNQSLDEHVTLYLRLCGDLLSKIFVRTNAVKLKPNGREVFHDPCDRFTAEDVMAHPFWDVHSIR